MRVSRNGSEEAATVRRSVGCVWALLGWGTGRRTWIETNGERLEERTRRLSMVRLGSLRGRRDRKREAS